MSINQPHRYTLKKSLIWFYIQNLQDFSYCFQQYLYEIFPVLSFELFLNKKLFFFKKSNLLLCSFCNEKDETVFHLYFYCPNVRNCWNKLKFYLPEDLMLPPQTLEAAVFGDFVKGNIENAILYLLYAILSPCLIFYHLVLVFKLYVFCSVEKRFKIEKKLKKKTCFILKKRTKYKKSK